MSSRRNALLTKEYTNLIESIREDKRLILATAESCKTILKDTPELIDGTFKESFVDSLKVLHEAETELEVERSALRNFDRDAGSGDITKNFLEEISKASSRRRGEALQPELMCNAGSTRSGKKADQSGTNADLEVVEVEENQDVRMDPISLRPIKVLVQNRRCKHFYCFETIIAHIESGPYPRCPIAGCRLPHIRRGDIEFVN